MPPIIIRNIIKKYSQELKNNNINFKHIYLFGSYAKGNAHKDSDIDIAIISPKVERGKELLKKKMTLGKLTIKIDPRIEPILLEENELVEGETSIMGDQVVKTGILIE